MRLSNVVISPAMIAPGDTFSFSCKITMGSTERPSEIRFYLGNNSRAPLLFGVSDVPAAGKSRTYSYSHVLSPGAFGAQSFSRGDQMWLKTSAFIGTADNSMWVDAEDAGVTATYLDAWREPGISAFSARRFADGAASAIGTTVAVSLQAAVAEGTVSTGMTCALSYREANDSVFSVPVTVPLADALAGVTDNTAYLSALTAALGNAYDLELCFGDAYESVVRRIRLTKASTKFCVSKAAEGVAVGQHSTAAAGSPKFEVAYPLYAYAGIRPLTHAQIVEMLGVQTDTFGYGAKGVAANGITDTQVVFPVAYKQPPILSIYTRNGNPGGTIGSHSFAVVNDSLTATGFTLRWYNNTGSARWPSITWVAMGELDV